RSFAWRDSRLLMLGIAAFGTLTTFVLPAFVGFRQLRRAPLASVLLGTWLLVPILLPLAAAILFKPLESHRYAAYGLPALLILVASGYLALGVRLRVFLAAIAILLTAFSIFRYANHPLKDDWRSATPCILSSLEKDDLLLFDTEIELVSFTHYARGSEDSIPPLMLGRTSTPSEVSLFRGKLYRHGQPLDQAPKRYADEVFARRSVCLVLCVPRVSLERYTDVFREQGFRLRQFHAFHRILVVSFGKE